MLEIFQKLFTSKDYEFDQNYDWVTAVNYTLNKKNNSKVLKDASICHSDEYAKCQNQIESNYFIFYFKNKKREMSNKNKIKKAILTQP